MPAAAEEPPAGTWTVAAAGTWAEPGTAPERHKEMIGLFTHL